MKEKCNAKTKKGNRCKKPQMEGSGFCFIHQYIDNFGKFNKPFWQNSTVHFLLAVCAILYAMIFGASKDNQMKIIQKLNIPAHLAIAELADRSFWEGTKGCGDRISYKNLLSLREKAENNIQKKEIQDHVNRIIDDYKTSILIPRLDNENTVCQRGTMKNGICDTEPVEGFSASNVAEHLDITKYPRCTSRARALNILRNFDTAKGENKEDLKKEIIKRLVFIIENDPSLLVSKLAVDRYEQFTDYSAPSEDLFDFKSPIEHNKAK